VFGLRPSPVFLVSGCWQVLSMVNVRFEPDGVSSSVDAGTLLSDAAHRAGLSLHLPCAGAGRCGKCRVTVLSGDVGEATDAELASLTPAELDAGVRLACQVPVRGDAIVQLPPEAHVVGQKSLDGGVLRPVALEPVARQVSVTLTKPSLQDQRSDFDRLADALASTVPDLHGCPAALGLLPSALRADGFSVTASLVGSRLVDVIAGMTPPPTYGAAVDIGTTTVVVYVVDLLTGELKGTAAAYNEQGRHGADVISRIEYCSSNSQGLEELRGLVVKTVDDAMAQALADCGRGASDVYEVTVVGNTAMNHLFIGMDPRHLAEAPYVPVSARAHELRPSEAGISMHPRGSVFCLPSIAGFVGADTVGVLLATDIARRGHAVLAVDIGTNGELALWSGKELLVASCAAGPAFEGAQIEFGMRAAPGAIEHVSIGATDVQVQTIAKQPAVGICGSGLFDAMAVLLELGAVEPSGRFRDTELPETTPEAIRSRLVGEGRERRFILGDPAAAAPVYLSQGDVRELQLAKGAVRAAADLLLQEAGIEPQDVGEVLLAGAFGNYIDPVSALRMGMLPQVPVERIRGVGNAAGAGALLALVSQHERQRALELAREARHIELSRRPDFQMAFMETILFP